MSHVISSPIEELIHPQSRTGDPTPPEDRVLARPDIVIVGSGYGASVAAMKLAGLRAEDGRDIEVMVLERGKEHAVGEFPTDLGELPGHVRIRGASDAHPTGNPDALFDVRRGEDLDVLVGNGLGGGSLINANVAARPDASVFESWPAKYRDGLDEIYDRVEAELVGTARSFPVDLPKFEAWSATVEACGWGDDLEVAPITVKHHEHEKDEPGSDQPVNRIAIDQSSCTRCGNCVTGCNVGAKNTLMMNLIPLARERGARFHTGANVTRVRPIRREGGRRWQVEIQRTHSIKTPLEDERFLIEARYVILAAGTLGSTEILMRSAETADDFAVSARLGTRFSTNGDGLAFTYGQRRAVNAIGRREYMLDKGEGPGPTITGIVKGRLDDGSPFTFEDGVIPASLAKFFGEALITGAQLGRFARNRLPAYFDQRASDPLAFDREVLQHGQVFLMMSDDGARRSLSLRGPDDARDSSHCCVVPSALSPEESERADATLDALDRRLSELDLGPAFDDGQFVANPAFRLFPRQAASAFGGRMPGRRNVSVHPLGGCPMGEDHHRGVVDADGCVFDPRSGRHEGLFVMDGAIIPGSLATNPFLTIAAVAWSCCDTLLDRLVEDESWTAAEGRIEEPTHTPEGLLPDDHAQRTRPRPPEARPQLVVREQLVGELTGRIRRRARERIAAILPGSERLFERDGIVIQIETDHVDVHERFASTDAHRLIIPARARLWINSESKKDAEQRLEHSAPRSLRNIPPDLEGTAQITLMRLDAPTGSGVWRGLEAVCAFLVRRGWPAFGGGGGGRTGWLESLASLRRSIAGTWKVAVMHGRYRRFDYRIQLDADPARSLVLEGQKRVRYSPRAEGLIDSLLQLPIERATFAGHGQRVTTKARLHVDASYIFDEGLIQASDCDDMTESAMSAFSFLAWFARCILESGFWEFAAPAYPERRAQPDLTPPPIRAGWLRKVEPVRVPLPVPAMLDHQPGCERLLPLDLHRYPQVGGGGPPVLLIHGLAQGSSIFTTPHMDHNMASYFWKRGYDVWVLDHRLSNRFDADQVPYGDWGIDAIGQIDVPAAVRHVYDTTESKVRIFAHCVGAIGVQIAILEGLLEREGAAGSKEGRTESAAREETKQSEKEKRQGKERGGTKSENTERFVESVCFNAIHPWVVPSPANLARAKLGTFFRGRLPDELLDPVLRPEAEVTAAQTLFDRLASTVARVGEGRRSRDDRGHGWPTATHRGICDRMTLLYGRMWRHRNLERSVRENWADLVGRAPAAVYQQLYSMLDHERILDDRGENTYLLESKLRDHWSEIPTFFLHGKLSDVFNPLSATRSAVRLDSVLNRGRNDRERLLIRQARIEGYGHMDPIIGKRAFKDSFRRIEHFFAVAAGVAPERPLLFDAYQSHDDGRPRRQKAPQVATAVRAAWIDGEDIVVRHWVEEDRFRSTPPTARVLRDGAAARGDDAAKLDLFYVEADEPWYAWFDQRTTPGSERYDPLRVVPKRPGSDAPAADAREPHLLFLPASRLAAMTDDEGFFLDEARSKRDVEDEPHYYKQLARRLEAERRGEAPHRERIDFVVGSCRYPGTPFEADLSDAVFAGMSRSIRGHGADMAFFVGDQIYADAYNDMFDGATGRGRYHDRYKAAFTSPHMAEVLRSLPVHFAIDDHEIVDDWSGSASQGDRARPREIFGPQAITYGRITDAQVAVAVRAARLHMSSAREARPVGRAAAPPRRSLWYALDHQREVGVPCFVLDTRSERELRSIDRYEVDPDPPRMMREGERGQLDAFIAWLELAHRECEDAPKFVFAGQVLAPLRRSFIAHPHTFRAHDGFVGYPRTLARIIEAIVDGGVRNVIFVGGDHHMSSMAKLTLRKAGRERTAWQIVASGLYSPMPFTNARPDEYDWHTTQSVEIERADQIGFDYEGEWITDARSHFARIAVIPSSRDGRPHWRVAVSAYDPQGDPAARQTAWFDADGDDMELVLE